MKLIFFFLFSVFVYAQITPPSGYTPFLKLRLYAGNSGIVNPSKDSLDANYSDIDAGVSMVNDSLLSLKSRVSPVINYSGNLLSGIIQYGHLSSGLQGVLLTTNTAQTITAQKIFSSNKTYFRHILPTATETYYLGYPEERWSRLYVNTINTNGLYITNSVGTDSLRIAYDDEQQAIRIDKAVYSSLLVDTLTSNYVTGNLLPTQADNKIGNDLNNYSSLYVRYVYSDSQLNVQGKQGGVNFLSGVNMPFSNRMLTSATTTIDVTNLPAVKLYPDAIVTNLHTFNDAGVVIEGRLLYVVNMANFNVTIKHGIGNIRCGADLVLGQFDTATFILTDIGGGSYRWLKLSSSDN
ncbi:hypothetical protein [Ignavibacterium sp.]|uniref:hypothetical protein n=1 Tax=Ignavibacterium sp. TaxID=2651167 RepID=UPI00307F7E98